MPDFTYTCQFPQPLLHLLSKKMEYGPSYLVFSSWGILYPGYLFTLDGEANRKNFIAEDYNNQYPVPWKKPDSINIWR